MTENEIRGLGQFSGAASDQHSHLSDSNLGSEGYGRSRSRSPGVDEFGMGIAPLNLGGSGSGTGTWMGRGGDGGGSRTPSYQQGIVNANVNANGNGSLPNSLGMQGFGGAQLGTIERWERDQRERMENERQRGSR